MPDANEVMNSHFGSYQIDIRIWNQINPEIRSRISDYFRLRLDVLAEVSALWEQFGYKH